MLSAVTAAEMLLPYRLPGTLALPDFLAMTTVIVAPGFCLPLGFQLITVPSVTESFSW